VLLESPEACEFLSSKSELRENWIRVKAKIKVKLRLDDDSVVYTYGVGLADTAAHNAGSRSVSHTHSIMVLQLLADLITGGGCQMREPPLGRQARSKV
jgi:hypothetical protein